MGESSGFRRVIGEIHRRSVWQVLAIYLFGAWIGYEAVQALTEGLGLPDWFPALAIVLFIIGLPIVVATAFVQEGVGRATPPDPTLFHGATIDGVEGREEIERRPAGGVRRLFTWRNALAGGVVAFALWGVVATGWLLFGGTERVASGANAAVAERRSIAVLPFENMSGGEENEAFTTGIHDDILTQLAKIGELRVISRTSVREYANTTKNIRQIGDELDVGTVLEGGVQRAGDRIRVNAQLIDARTDEHLWAEGYDRQLTAANIFEIQTDLALKIASALHATLSPSEAERLEVRPTDDLEAYEYYLRGREYYWGTSEESGLRAAIRLYEQAIETDPQFAAAHAALSLAHSLMWWFYIDRTPDRLSRAKAAVDRALELDPDLPEAHIALGYYQYWGHLDYDRALQEFATAERSLPNSADLMEGIAAVRRRQGRFEEAVEYFAKAVELDPRAAIRVEGLAGTYQLLRRFDDAQRLFDRVTDLAPDIADFHLGKADAYVAADGNTTRAREVVSEARRAGARPPEDIERMASRLEYLDRNYEQALAIARTLPEEAADHQFEYLPRPLLVGQLEALLGRADQAASQFEDAVAVLEARIQENPEDSRLYSSLGLALAGLGRKAEAVQAGERAVGILPVEREAWRGAVRVEHLAQIYAVVGERERSIERLELLLARPGPLTVGLLKLDPVWDPLRTHPDFKRLVERER